jgi:hypothetical protein
MSEERRGVAVVLLSYNRPKMLELAWKSIVAPTVTSPLEIILVDDGSDVFDPERWADDHDIRWRVFGTPRTLDRRMTQPSLGRLINGALHVALHSTRLAAVAYLCDDDLFAPGWTNAVESALRDPNEGHVVRGAWRSFDDPLTGGEPLARPGKTRPTPLDVRRMTTGNFAHRVECYVEGFRWSETTVAVHDDTALWNLNRIHPLGQARDLRSPAGYRREHAYNMARYTSHQDYAVGAEEVLKRGALE